ncbi:hypothetical protein FNF31_04373 [Cafeteria roenbergensis]|uniref:Uncharacterized protein n=1 Tax=Cafeteria roenbergensis TaxID=33653 RepID=A0A5A8D4Q4_CAFRO|nr:hypothetical protein FNF31_04373 [Cafeteria roenbergensis]KAA0161192.1 hypothetical protein FNF28_05141 [Cafeteria roenbergensis]
MAAPSREELLREEDEAVARAAIESDDPEELAQVARRVPTINEAPLLALAAKLDAVKCCQWLLAQPDVDPNLGKRKTTPICAAAAAGAGRAVEALLRDGRANPNAARMDGVTPLLIATQQRHLSVVRQLLLDRRTRCNSRAIYPLRITPLLLALRSGSPEAVHMLLDLGRDLDLAQNHYQRDSPLQIARDLGCSPSIERMLLDFEATGAVHADLARYLHLDEDPAAAAAALATAGTTKAMEAAAAAAAGAGAEARLPDHRLPP